MRRIAPIHLQLRALKDETVGLIEAYAADQRVEGLTFKSSRWRHPAVLGPLYATHGLSCAYCQGPLTHSDRGDVEHFRPKSVYWWLAYQFANYLLSCARCNRTHKGDKFPLIRGERVTYERRQALEQELRALCHPDLDPVEDWFRMRQKDSFWLVIPSSRLSSVSDPLLRIQDTIDFFKLNTDPMLLVERSNAINEALQEARDRLGTDVSDQRLRKRASRYAPYGVFIRRAYARQFPHLVPQDTDELVWLIEDYAKEINAYRTILRDTPDADVSKSALAIFGSALAFIWRYPPVGPADFVERKLMDFGVLGEVRPYYQRLVNGED